MPLYVFRCACGREFEDLCATDTTTQNCPDCGQQAERKIAQPFGIGTKINPRTETVYSRKEIDKVVGAASEKRWEGYNERWKRIYQRRREARRAGQDLKEVTIKPDSSGKVVPFEHLGNKSERKFRQGYSHEYKKQITQQGKDPKTPVVMKNSP